MKWLTESTMTDDPKMKELILNDEVDMQKFETFTKGELSFCGRENIEGYAALVNLFLRSMTLNA